MHTEICIREMQIVFLGDGSKHTENAITNMIEHS